MADELRDAVRRGDLVRAQKLLEDPKTRRSINALDNGSSCLHLAIATKQMSMCLLLLSYGADVNQEDGCGYSPIHLAVLVAEQMARRRRLARLTQPSPGRPPKPPEQYAQEAMTAATGKKHNSQGSTGAARADGSAENASTTASKEETDNPLEVGDLSFLVLLLRRGADVDKPRQLVSRREVTSTPLFEAVCQCEVELVKVFLEHDADPNIKGWARDSLFPEPALHVAARRPSKHQVEVCKLLLQYGSSPGALAGDGGIDDDGAESIVLFDAAEKASDSWIKSLIQGLQLTEQLQRKADAEHA